MPASRARIESALQSLPKPGGGGYHTRLLGVANVLIAEGMAPEAAVEAIRRHTPQGTRHVSDREIEQAVEKAWQEKPVEGRPGRTIRRPPPPAFDAPAFMARLQEQGAGWSLEDLRDASPVALPRKPEMHAIRLVESLYDRDDLLYCGERVYDKTRRRAAEQCIRRAADWVAAWRKGEPIPPHIIPNPLTGEWGKTKDGKPSLRADECVRSFRFAVIEFDGLSLEEQVRFWTAVDLPVCALIASGGKSIHGWIRVDSVSDAASWSVVVEEKLFGMLTPLGCDAACRNEARLSRLPGHFRAENDRWQHLLYLAPEGRRVWDLDAVESLERQIAIAHRHPPGGELASPGGTRHA